MPLQQLLYGALFLLQYSCHNPDRPPIKEMVDSPVHGPHTGLNMMYNKEKIIVGVDHDDIDSIYMADHIYRGEKYFSSIKGDTLIALNTSADRTYLYMICTHESNPESIFHDYTGFIANGKYHATKRVNGNYVQQDFDLAYDKTKRILETSYSTKSQILAELSSIQFEQHMASFLDSFAFPIKSLNFLLDKSPYNGSFKNVKIPLAELNSADQTIVKNAKDIRTYPEYYFQSKIDKRGYVYYLVDRLPNTPKSTDYKEVEDVIKKYLRQKKFDTGRFHNLPANYELNIRVTFKD